MQTLNLSAQVPARILDSRLLQQGGFELFEGLTTPDLQAGLYEEAIRQLPQARLSEVTETDHEDVRGGRPPRRFSSAPGGALQDKLYHIPWMYSFLHERTGLWLEPTGQHGTYSYYLQAGDHLALHRDIETCDLTVITCLHYLPGAGGRLHLYPDHLFTPLSRLRKEEAEGGVALELQVGQSLVFFGGIVPHVLSPLTQGQERMISVLCYRA